jgi:hypothetical protein
LKGGPIKMEELEEEFDEDMSEDDEIGLDEEDF